MNKHAYKLLFKTFLVLTFLTSCKTQQTIYSNPTVTLKPPVSTASNFYGTSSSYRSQISSINAVQSWNYLYQNVTSNKPGENIKVLVVDSALDQSFTPLQGNIYKIHIPDPVITYRNLTPSEKSITTNAKHGTQVTSLIASQIVTSSSGAKDAGVAWGTKIGFLEIGQKSNSSDDMKLEGLTPAYSALSDSYIPQLIASNGYRVMNMSYGGQSFNPENNTIIEAVTNYDVLIIAATGNRESQEGYITNNGQNPLFPAQNASNFNALNYKGGFLAVTGSTGVFDNCGNAKAFCLGAPNQNISVPTSLTQYGPGNGTSYGTPLVSGSAAVIMGAYPSLTAPQVRDFILRGATPKYDATLDATITKRRTVGGIYNPSSTNTTDGDVSNVYGWGTLDLYTSIELIQSTTVKGTSSSLASSRVLLGSSANVPQNLRVESYDKYGSYIVPVEIKTNNVNSYSNLIASSMYGASLNNYSSVQFNGSYISMPNITQNHFVKNSDVSASFNGNIEMTGMFQNAMFLTHNFAGYNFSYQNNYIPQGMEITKNIDTFKPFEHVAFLNARPQRFAVAKNFNNTLVTFVTLVGKNNIQNFSNETNLSQTVSFERHGRDEMVGFEAGMLREGNTMLGSYSSGALSLGRNNVTSFARLKFLQNVYENVFLIGSYALGRTSVNVDKSSLFSNFSSLMSSSFIVGASVKNKQGSVDFTYSEPLSITSGYAYFNGYNGMQRISLVPTKQEQNLGIAYSKSNENTSVSLQALYIRNANNMNNPDSFGLVARFSRGF